MAISTWNRSTIFHPPKVDLMLEITLNLVSKCRYLIMLMRFSQVYGLFVFIYLHNIEQVFVAFLKSVFLC